MRKLCRECSGGLFVLNEQEFRDGSKHLRAQCFNCDTFYQFIKAEETKDPVLYFGKYKGQTLSKVFEDDPAYLDWLARECKFETIRTAAGNLIKTAAMKEALHGSRTDTRGKDRDRTVRG